ncbi:MAG: rRNA maturation RNase YbeY [Methylacidiphilales bacterium]|nr:rRNA maturation RNase YbeY [Candidatus Methylacidiphilales bacterium]
MKVKKKNKQGNASSPFPLTIQNYCYEFKPPIHLMKTWLQAAGWKKHQPLSLLFFGLSRMKTINGNTRGRNVPTDVLSFQVHNPTLSKYTCVQNNISVPIAYFGEIVLCPSYIASDAKRYGLPFTQRLAHVTIHAFLHLIGYDHVTSRDQLVMETKEIKVLRSLDIPNPYLWQ